MVSVVEARDGEHFGLVSVEARECGRGSGISALVYSLQVGKPEIAALTWVKRKRVTERNGGSTREGALNREQ